jgi:hypothetical protein
MSPPSPSLHAVRRCWNAFFHTPADPRVCALIRIGYAALVLVNLAVLYRHLDEFFGETGVLPYDVSRLINDPDCWTVLGWLPRTRPALHACFWVFVAQTVCLLLGVASRLNAVCVFIWLVSFQNRNVLVLDGEDSVFRLIGFFLILMPLGQVWAIDALFRPKTAERIASGWALRLLQIQMAIIYFSAALLKLQGDPWIDGTALYYVSRLDDYFGRFPLPDFLFDAPSAVKLLTWSVIAVEFFVSILVWFRETRLACLLVAVLFHLACDYSMNLFLFHWIMLVGWTSFLTGDDLDRLWKWLKPRQR